MIPEVSRETLMEAMKRFDKDLRHSQEWQNWEHKGNFLNAIEFDGRLYPVKKIISMAAQVSVGTFSGGHPAQDYLRRKGFSIVRIRDRLTTDQNNRAQVLRRPKFFKNEINKDLKSQFLVSERNERSILRVVEDSPSIDHKRKIDFSIYRIVTQKPPVHSLDPDTKQIEFATYCIKKACIQISEKVTLIQTPGRFLSYYFDLRSISTGTQSKRAAFDHIIKIVEKEVIRFLSDDTIFALMPKAKFLTLGVDVFHPHRFFDPRCTKHVELVGTFDISNRNFIGWTGKSYPVPEQEDTLLYCVDLNSHFQIINDIQVMVLGCNDLTIFNPRVRESCSPTSYKGKLINDIQKLSDKFRPLVLLQHPHFSDSSKTWASAWAGVRKYLPTIQMYSAGINYANSKGVTPRESIDKVLRSTASGFVRNCIF